MERKNKADLIHGFAVVKVLFEYKSELDDRIKKNSKTTNLRSTINNNLLNRQRVRRRFIRNREDLFSTQNQTGGNSAVENSSVFRVGSEPEQHEVKTTGVNNFILGKSSAQRARDYRPDYGSGRYDW